MIDAALAVRLKRVDEVLEVLRLDVLVSVPQQESLVSLHDPLELSRVTSDVDNSLRLLREVCFALVGGPSLLPLTSSAGFSRLGPPNDLFWRF